MKLITNIFSSQSLTKLILNSKINRCKKVSIASTIYVYSNVIGFVYCLLYYFYAFLQYLTELTNCISEYNERYGKTSSTGIPIRSEINRTSSYKNFVTRSRQRQQVINWIFKRRIYTKNTSSPITY